MQAGKGLRICAGMFIAALLGFLLLGGAGAAAHRAEQDSYYENRFLAEWPEFRWEALWDGSWFSGVDRWIQDRCAGRNTLLRIGTRLDMALRPVVNGVVVTDQVLLGETEFWSYSRADVAVRAGEMADTLAAHARQVESYGGVFCYVAVPHQLLAWLDALPPYLQSHADYFQDSSELLFAALTERGVPWIDMRSVMTDAGILRECCSTVDNHYNITGAYWTYRTLMERLNQEAGWTGTPLGEGDFSIETLPNPYLGSRNRKLFGLWPSGERPGILKLQEDIPFRRLDHVSWAPEPYSVAGVYNLPWDGTQAVDYTLYMGGDIPFTEIRTDRPDKPTILIYGDSFTNPVECILWRDCDTLYSLDLRHYTEKSLADWIAEYQPDAVVCIRDYEALLSRAGNGQ